MNKHMLRKQLLRARKQLPDELYNTHSTAICVGITHLLSTRSPQAIHSFLPIYAQKEPNIMPVLHNLYTTNTPVYTSVMTKEDIHLKHVRIYPDTQFSAGVFGIPTPVQAEDVPLATLQNLSRLLVLVPLLAFDNTGHRLGYGKGCYDRLLSALPGCHAVGVSFTPPVQTVFPESFDVSLQACVTPKRTYFFAPTP